MPHSTSAFCIDKHIVGGKVFYKQISSVVFSDMPLLYSGSFKLSQFTNDKTSSQRQLSIVSDDIHIFILLSEKIRLNISCESST